MQVTPTPTPSPKTNPGTYNSKQTHLPQEQVIDLGTSAGQ